MQPSVTYVSERGHAGLHAECRHTIIPFRHTRLSPHSR